MSDWWVRDRGQELGPFTLQKLRQMREHRQLQGFQEVSQDRREWQAAELVPGLFDDRALPFTTPPPAIPIHRSAVNYIIGGVVVLIVVLLGVGIYFWIKNN